MAYKNLTVQYFADKAGNWRWHVKARNSKLVAASGESFASKSNAIRAWRAFRRGVESL